MEEAEAAAEETEVAADDAEVAAEITENTAETAENTAESAENAAETAENTAETAADAAEDASDGAMEIELATAEASAAVSSALSEGAAGTPPGAKAASPASEGRLKRPKSAYFLFMEEKRSGVKAEHPEAKVTDLARLISDLWRALGAEEKGAYEERAKKLKEEYQRKVAELKASGLDPQGDSAASDYDVRSMDLAFPLSRVRKAALSDPEVKRMGKEPVAVVAKAMEHFLLLLGASAAQQALFAKRRTVKAVDVANAVYTKRAFKFLRDEPFSTLRERSANAAASRPAKKMRTENHAAGMRSITSFFAKKN